MLASSGLVTSRRGARPGPQKIPGARQLVRQYGRPGGLFYGTQPMQPTQTHAPSGERVQKIASYRAFSDIAGFGAEARITRAVHRTAAHSFHAEECLMHCASFRSLAVEGGEWMLPPQTGAKTTRSVSAQVRQLWRFFRRAFTIRACSLSFIYTH
jgi:hypothetical protein